MLRAESEFSEFFPDIVEVKMKNEVPVTIIEVLSDKEEEFSESGNLRSKEALSESRDLPDSREEKVE